MSLKGIFYFFLIQLVFCSTLPVFGQLPDLPSWIEDTVFIDPTYMGPEEGSLEKPFVSLDKVLETPNTAYLWKRGTTYLHKTGMKWVMDHIYLGAYGKGAKPVLRPNTPHRSIQFLGSYTFIQNIEVFPQDTNSSRGVEFTLKERSVGFADSVIVHGCFIGFGGWNCSRLDVNNVEVYNTKHDGMYFANCDSTIFKGCHIWNINTDWAWRPDIAYSGGDCIQTENVGYVYVDASILDHSYWGGKFALITNGNDTTICKNSTFKSADGTSALYISKTFMDKCHVIGGDRGVWNIGGNRFFVHNTIFEDCKNAIYGTASEVYNCTFVNISETACYGWVLGWDVRNSIFYNVNKIFASTDNVIATHNIYYNPINPQPTSDWGEDNFYVDPLFVDHENRDYQLKPLSPAIDSGVYLEKVRADIVHTPRPQNSSYDIGAYEFPVEDLYGKQTFNVYARIDPTEGIFYIYFKDKRITGGTTIKVYDTLGRLLATENTEVYSDDTKKIMLFEPLQGAFLINIKNKNKSFTIKALATNE
jgi:hypothetical protein